MEGARGGMVRVKRRGGMRPRLKAGGFTLLELLVVLVIIGLLVGYVGPKYFAQIDKSKVKTAQAQMKGFEEALDQYRLDVGRYPGTGEGLKALIQAPPNAAHWQGPYLKKAPPNAAHWQGPYLKKAPPADPWGNAYVYRSPGANGADYDLLSYGQDGKPGGEGLAVDIPAP